MKNSKNKFNMNKIVKRLNFNKGDLLNFEYLIIKYDILYKEYINYAEKSQDKNIKNDFYIDINKVIRELTKRANLSLVECEGLNYYYGFSDLLADYFNLKKKEYAQVRKILKKKVKKEFL